MTDSSRPPTLSVANVRLGLATNSSSSHSLIFLDGLRDDDVCGAEFGWGQFTAASRETRLDYLALTLRHNLEAITSEAIADAVVRQWTGADLGRDGYIDHQSVYSLPREWSGQGIDRPFFEEFSRFLLQPGLAVLGGNDNGGEHHLADRGFTLEIPQDYGSAEFVARKDAASGFWTIFNRETGAKVRFSFERTATAPHRVAVPELVDVKITDTCPFGCSYCYQASTPTGARGRTDLLRQLPHVLGELRVFEVAIGGGEPTLDPEFVSVLDSFRYSGVVPNFTTKNLGWLRDPKQSAAILRACGAFSYSVEDGDDVRELGALLKVGGVPREKASVQAVLGVVDGFGLRSILEAAAAEGIRVTLLGYKRYGFGAMVQPKECRDWIGVVLELSKKGRMPAIAIDTALVVEHEAELKKRGVPEWMYHKAEGAFSCYIDAVEGAIAPSSYCDPSERVKLSGGRDLRRDVLAAYGSFQVAA